MDLEVARSRRAGGTIIILEFSVDRRRARFARVSAPFARPESVGQRHQQGDDTKDQDHAEDDQAATAPHSDAPSGRL